MNVQPLMSPVNVGKVIEPDSPTFTVKLDAAEVASVIDVQSQ